MDFLRDLDKEIEALAKRNRKLGLTMESNLELAMARYSNGGVTAGLLLCMRRMAEARAQLRTAAAALVLLMDIRRRVSASMDRTGETMNIAGLRQVMVQTVEKLQSVRMPSFSDKALLAELEQLMQQKATRA